MKRLAFTTFAIMRAPYGAPEVRGFEGLTPAVFREAELAPGFIDRARETDDNVAGSNFERDWGAWGKFGAPSFYDGGFTLETDTRASTLSLWTDIDSVFAFVSSGLHAKALMQRGKWFRPPAWPSYAMWWVDGGQIPAWADAVAALERLHAQGPSPAAFSFKQPYDPDGGALPALSLSLAPAMRASSGQGAARPLERSVRAAILELNPSVEIEDESLLVDLGIDSLGLIRLLVMLDKKETLDLEAISEAQPPRTYADLLSAVARAAKNPSGSVAAG